MWAVYTIGGSPYFPDIECAGAAQGGTIDEDYALAAVATTNGTFVLAGTTRGDWGGPNAGDVDFAALKLDADGNVIWKWQVSKATDTTLTK